MFSAVSSASTPETSFTPEEKKEMAEIVKLLMVQMGQNARFMEMRDVYMKQHISAWKYMHQDAVKQDNPGMADLKSAEIEAGKRYQAWITRYTEDVEKEITFDKYVDKVFVPIFLRYFTLDELRFIAGFYSHPTARKFMQHVHYIKLNVTSQFTQVIYPDMEKLVRSNLDKDMQKYLEKRYRNVPLGSNSAATREK
jgi:hypothetical protein